MCKGEVALGRIKVENHRARENCIMRSFIICTFRQMQDDGKVTQPILKCLLMVAIQYISIGSINTQYRCDYIRSYAGYVML
jgi:hypothetical protein